MRLLTHEIVRFCRAIPLEFRVRWHAWRAVRHHDLRNRHKAALDAAMVDTRELLEATP